MYEKGKKRFDHVPFAAKSGQQAATSHQPTEITYEIEVIYIDFVYVSIKIKLFLHF